MLQWVKDLLLPQLRYRLQLRVGFDPYPGTLETSICHRCSQKKKKKGRKKETQRMRKQSEQKNVIIIVAIFIRNSFLCMKCCLFI